MMSAKESFEVFDPAQARPGPMTAALKMARHERDEQQARAIAAENDAEGLRVLLATGWSKEHIAAILADNARLEAQIVTLSDALREIVLWCEEGREPVCAWPAERARSALVSTVLTRKKQPK